MFLERVCIDLYPIWLLLEFYLMSDPFLGLVFGLQFSSTNIANTGIFSGNLSGNIFVNNYLIQGTGMLEILGIWYLLIGRRSAISSSFLIAALALFCTLPFNYYGELAYFSCSLVAS